MLDIISEIKYDHISHIIISRPPPQLVIKQIMYCQAQLWLKLYNRSLQPATEYYFCLILTNLASQSIKELGTAHPHLFYSSKQLYFYRPILEEVHR